MHSHGVSASPPRAQLRMEPLEDRLAPATFTVTNTIDAGSGSLRWAINHANSTPGADIIAFDIQGTGVQTISPMSALPTITDQVAIKGQTQPGFAGTPMIQLNGASAGHGIPGLVIWSTASGTVVRGLVINNFNADGLRIQANNCRIFGNFIGTDAAGNATLGNAGCGVKVFERVSGNVIGGTTPGARNVISGNGNDGVLISGPGNRVEGNYIGTNAAGTADLGNRNDGVFVGGAGGASGNVIGGTTPDARNVISGNDGNGVELNGFDARGNVLQGNYIGTDATGTTALGNTMDGVLICDAASHNVVGGTNPSARNVISGNDGQGVELDFTGTSGNRVQGNRIGVAANGSTLGNGGDGVRISRGARDNSIGGTPAGAGNVIAYNGGAGVWVQAGIGNAIQSNRIFANAGLGIDLGPAGVTPNDVDDPDIGANRQFNFPLLYVAREFFEVIPYPGPGVITHLALRVRGSINTEMNKTLRIEFFASPATDPSGNGEGARFLGATTVTTGNANTVSFNVVLSLADDFAGQFVTATATDELGNTSEFSASSPVID